MITKLTSTKEHIKLTYGDADLKYYIEDYGKRRDHHFVIEVL